MHGLQVFVDAGQQGGAVLRRSRGKAEPCHLAGGDTDHHAQAGDRVEAVDGCTVVRLGLGVQRRPGALTVAPQKAAPVSDVPDRHDFSIGFRKKVRR